MKLYTIKSKRSFIDKNSEQKTVWTEVGSLVSEDNGTPKFIRLNINPELLYSVFEIVKENQLEELNK